MKRYFLLATSLLALAGPATAQMHGPGGLRGFGLLEFDANADGKLTKSELDAGIRARFNQIDGNRDGAATPEEIRVGMEAQAKEHREAAQKARFIELDKDKNGQISQIEFLAGAESRDGGLRMRDGRGPGPVLMFGGPGGPFGERGPRGPRGDAASPPGAPAADRPLRAGPADADGDGKLTFAEFSARTAEAFTRADGNKDGTVTIAELQAMKGPR
jgi:EF hand